MHRVNRAAGHALLLGLVAGAALLAAQSPWQILLPAAVPAAVAIALLRRVARPASRGVPLAVAVLWGLVAAPPLAVGVNELIDLPPGWRSALVGPLVEELGKAAGLLLVARCWRGALRGAGDGIVLGALAGVGFTAAENLHYFALAAVGGGEAGLVESAYLRGVLGGLLHPTYSAAAGAGLGAARRARGAMGRLGLPWVGLAAAIVQHVAWNAVGAAWLHAAPCGPVAACAPAGEARFLLLVAPATIALFVGPGILALVLWARCERGALAASTGAR